MNLDFKQVSVLTADFVQNDNGNSVIEFTILDSIWPVDITGQSVRVAFMKPDFTLVIQDQTTGVTILDGPSGTLECKLLSQTLAAVGTVKGEISFSLNGNRLSTAQFSFTVLDSLDNGTGLISANVIPELDAKMLDLQAQYDAQLLSLIHI